jgi:hypothetical protein
MSLFDNLVKSLTKTKNKPNKTGNQVIVEKLKEIQGCIATLNASIEKSEFRDDPYSKIKFLAFYGLGTEESGDVAVTLKLASAAMESYLLMISLREAVQYLTSSMEKAIGDGDTDMQEFYFHVVAPEVDRLNKTSDPAIASAAMDLRKLLGERLNQKYNGTTPTPTQS